MTRTLLPFLLPAVLAVCVLGSAAALAEMRLDDNSRNFLRNGSFEVGWCKETGRKTIAGDSRFVDETWITDEAAYHGKHSLKLMPVKPWYGRSIGLTCFTIPVALPPGPLYSVSLWAKAVKDEATLAIQVCRPHVMGSRENPGIRRQPVKHASARATVDDTQWTQLKVTVPGMGERKVYLEISGQGVYVDAIEFLKSETLKVGVPTTDPDAGADDSLETDDELPPDDEEEGEEDGGGRFTPAAWVECGVSDNVPYGIHYQAEPTKLSARLFNYSKLARDAVVAYECMNQFGEVVIEDELKVVRLKPGERREVPWILPAVPNGKYSLKYWVKGGEDAWGEHVLVVMLAPVPGLRAPTGLLAYLTPSVVKLMKRAGLSYYATLCDDLRLRQDYNVETGELRDLSRIAKWGADADLMMFMAVNPCWWPVKAPQHWNESMPSRHPSPPPDPRTYEDALEKCAALYGPRFKHWWIQDELEGHWHPHEFLPVFNRTVEIVRKHRPDAEFFISAMGTWVDQFARLGGLENVDWLGGSVMNHAGNRGRKLGWLALKHNLRVYADAGGFTFFRPFSRLRGGSVHASWRLHHSLINSFFLHRSHGTSMYRAAPYTYDWSMVHDPFNVLEADGSMSSGLTLYAIAGQILAGAEPAPEPLGLMRKHGHYVWPFKDGRTGKPAVCFFPGHKRTVAIDLKPEDLKLADQLGNLIEIGQALDGKTRLELNRRFYFLYAANVETTALQEALRQARVERQQADKPVPETYAYCEPDEEKTVRIAVVTVSRDGAEPPRVTKETIDSQYAYREGFPLRSQRVPREVSSAQPRVWLASARPVSQAPGINGDFREWQPEISSAIYISDHVLASVDNGQLHAYRDAFKISWDLGMDYRVEWFAGYDEANLYFCARVFDDQLVARDQVGGEDEPDFLELRLDRDVSGDLVEPSTDDDLSVLLTPDQGGKALRTELALGEDARRSLAGAKGALAIWDDPAMLEGWTPWKHPGPHVGYLIEVALPWQALRIEPKPGAIFGFDVFAHETDLFKGKAETSVLRWAGGARPTGQLRLGAKQSEAR